MDTRPFTYTVINNIYIIHIALALSASIARKDIKDIRSKMKFNNNIIHAFPKKSCVCVRVRVCGCVCVCVLYIPVNNFFSHVGMDLPGFNQY